MNLSTIEASLLFCIFSLGLFLGVVVRPLLAGAMRRDPALIGPILTAMFSRYNLVTLVLAVMCLAFELVLKSSHIRLLLVGALVAIVAAKLPVDQVVKRREGAGQIRGEGSQGKQLNRLHRIVEAATALILLLSFTVFSQISLVATN